MKAFKKILKKYNNLIKSRKVSIVLFIVIIITVQITSIFCAISVLNFSQLLSHIKVPAGYVYIDTDIYAPETMTVQVPYEIFNPGIYDLADIELTVDLSVNYINQSNQANITSLVFSKTSPLKACKPFSTLSGDFEGSFLNFFIPPLVEFFDDADEFEMVYYLLDIHFTAKYFFGLISFQYTENNLNLFDF